MERRNIVAVVFTHRQVPETMRCTEEYTGGEGKGKVAGETALGLRT